ncbi:MAG: hypothetical protein P9M13_03760, partial [Candidatus Ancaeobacter aquaticus]|nr:hypothetical protein [Candidatus Ancaeobacter aquaticus]
PRIRDISHYQTSKQNLSRPRHKQDNLHTIHKPRHLPPIQKPFPAGKEKGLAPNKNIAYINHIQPFLQKT